MSGSIYAAPGMLPGGFDYQAQLEQQDAAAKQFAVSAARVLTSLCPLQTDLIEALRESFVGWVCCGTEQQLRAIRESKTHSLPYEIEIETAEDRLVSLSQRRDKLTVEIERGESSVQDMPEGWPMGGMFDLAIIEPMRKELAYVESEMSRIQRSIEAANARNPESRRAASESD